MSESKRWCLPKSEASEEGLQRNIDYVCGLGLDCGPIKENGACFAPNTVRAHAAYVMNAYFQATEGNDFDCDFDQTGTLTTVDPSKSHKILIFILILIDFFLISQNSLTNSVVI